MDVDDQAAIDQVREKLSGKAIVGYWCVQDIQSFRPELTPQQCWEILETTQANFDANLGINWQVLFGFAQAMFLLNEGAAETIDAKFQQSRRWADEWIEERFERARWQGGGSRNADH